MGVESDLFIIDLEMDSSCTSSQQEAMRAQHSGVDLQVHVSWVTLPSSPAACPHHQPFIIGNHTVVVAFLCDLMMQ